MKKIIIILLLMPVLFLSCNNPDDNTFTVRGWVRWDHDEYIDIPSRLVTMYSDKWKFTVYCEADYNWDFCWYPGRGSRERLHGVKWNENKKRYTMDITQCYGKFIIIGEGMPESVARARYKLVMVRQ